MTTKVLFISLLFSAKIFLAAEMEVPQSLSIMAAIYENKTLEEIKSLVENKANVDEKREQDGYSALMYATQKDRLDLVKFLLENNAKVNATDQEGHSAFCFAKNSEIEAALKESGAVPHLVNDDSELYITSRLLSFLTTRCINNSQ